MRLTPVVADPEEIVAVVAAASGEQVALRDELDVDVYRMRRRESGPDWVVRVVDDHVGRAALDTAAAVLAGLDPTSFPAERCVDVGPVLTFGDAGAQRHLLLTEYVEPSAAPKPGFALAWCAGLLGHLAKRSGNALPPGGGWHRLGLTPTEEIDAALRLAGTVGQSVGELVDLLADADDGIGLPEALVHADLTPPNAIVRGEQPPVIIDWIGVGRGPRIWPFAFLLFAAGPRAAHVVLERYGRSVTLTDEEWDRLPEIMIARPLTLDLWSVAYERMSPRQAQQRAQQHLQRVDDVVAAARAAR
jgi:Ser/Thr protein kinase RdoA (MazF antagonist)